MQNERKRNRIVRRIAAMLIVGLLVICTAAVLADTDTKTQKQANNTVTPSNISIRVVENIGVEGDSENNTESSTETYVKSISWTENTEAGVYTADKQVQILNEDEETDDSTDAYIRAAIVPKWVTTVTKSESDTSGSEVTIAESVVVGTPGVYELETFGTLTELNWESTGCSYSMVNSNSTDNTNSTDLGGIVTFTLNSDWGKSWVYNSKDGYFYYKYSVSPGDMTNVLLESVSIAEETYKLLAEYGIRLEVDILADAIQTQGGALEARWSESGITIGTTDDGESILSTEDLTEEAGE